MVTFLTKSKKIVLILSICIMLIFYYYFIHPHMTLENFKKHREIILNLVQAHWYGSILFYGLSYATVVALALPVALLMSLIGGFLFGTIIGTAIIIVSATAGATISFLIVRYIGGSYIQNRYAQQLATFNKEMDRYGAYYLLFVHFVPFIPFFVINVVSGLTKISIHAFIITTAVGIIPTTVLYTAIGNQLAVLETYPTYSLPLLLTFTGIALLMFLVLFLWRKKNNAQPPAS